MTTDEKSLDEIFGNETEQEDKVGQQETEVTKENIDSDVEVETKAGTTTAENESWTKAKAIDETKKRQARETEIAELKAENDRLKNSNNDPAKDLTVAEALLQERINMSTELMKDKHDDYADMEAVFLDMAKKNPELISEMVKSPNPAKFAYNKAKESLDFQEFKSSKESEEYKEFLEFKKNKGSVQKEESAAEKRNKSALNIPNINASTSAKVSINEGEKSLDEIFSKRRR